jgi:hypothetical protein
MQIVDKECPHNNLFSRAGLPNFLSLSKIFSSGHVGSFLRSSAKPSQALPSLTFYAIGLGENAPYSVIVKVYRRKKAKQCPY